MKCDFGGHVGNPDCDREATHRVLHSDSGCLWDEDAVFCEEHAAAMIAYWGGNSDDGSGCVMTVIPLEWVT
jgi:hypothetical protein